nr:IS5 family transposase [Mesorhizobium zhangyense]
MRRYELSDFEWSVIQPNLPCKVRGVARVDDCRVLNGILWRFRTGSPGADVPERYGPYTTCYNRFVRWRKAGVWDRLLAAVSTAFDGDIVMIDSSCVRVHQHATTAKKRGSDDGRATSCLRKRSCDEKWTAGPRPVWLHASASFPCNSV